MHLIHTIRYRNVNASAHSPYSALKAGGMVKNVSGAQRMSENQVISFLSPPSEYSLDIQIKPVIKEI